MSEKINRDDVKVVRELVKMMKTNELVEIKLKDEEKTIHLRRPEPQSEKIVQQMPAQFVNPAQGTPQTTPQPAPSQQEQVSAGQTEQDDSGMDAVSSPIVGTFYTAPTPEAEPFVKIGDRVTPETVVCIVEAMKVMNEIKAETSGVIEKVLVSNGESVEYGQELFKVKPD
ncbi:acetyl-CoA carboxylase biotin carboxyl carrier protein [Sedimentisphaera salicampi]|uniref:Biotin carboxyl carrier protein of acetyl-CoA carboxylase n=1 Tax=Sedimentisphaera salicampi TaxID=1941349 RepID=A0A1W6LPA5_9BACT|nr:acetyl-CoA carboxylase biotin carboxyl carrier protein [Sedimentisphaera salicampi]ARN57620.1 Biotin carboxyl carrier protein of acetyl-CoA carboxylase [Sedimentisphaera salicampi]